MLAPTTQRVEWQTPARINHENRERTIESVRDYFTVPERIQRRLEALDREWTVERIIEIESPLMILASLALGARDSRWRALALFACSMVVLHNVRGHYPLLPLLRRLGVRTQREISSERYALKAARGDFANASSAGDAFRAADGGRS